MLFGIVIGVVYTHHESGIHVLTGSGNNNLLSSPFQVSLCLGGVSEEAGGLDNDIGTHFAPRQVSRIALFESYDFVIAYGNRFFVVAYLSIKAPENRIIF